MNADQQEEVLSDVLAAWPSWGDRIAHAVKLEDVCVQVTDFLHQMLKIKVAACLLCVDEDFFCHISGATAREEQIRQSILDAWKSTVKSPIAEENIEWSFAASQDPGTAETPAEYITGPILSDGTPRGLVLANEDEGAAWKVDAVSALLGPSFTALERLRREGRRDPLTGISNRAAFQESLDRQLGLARRHETPVSILLLDLNRLKAVNDTFGHPAGDTVLKTLVERVRETIRESDVFSRFGGDEFAILLPQTDHAGAAVVAQRISGSLRDAPAEFGSRQIPISADIGIGGWTPGEPEPIAGKILNEADRDLYAKKSQGRGF